MVRYDRTGSSRDVPSTLALDSAGHVYVTGESEGAGNDDYVTIKYDSAGVQKWETRYNRPGNYADKPPVMAVDAASGDVHVAGQRVASTSFDYVIVKLNNAGSIQWVVTYNGPHESPLAQAEALAVDAAGNVCVTGWILDPATNYDYVTIKYSSAGDVLWIARYDAGNNLDSPTAMTVDATGNVYVTGRSRLPGFSTSDYATIKYNSAGVQLWVARYNRPGNNSDVPEALAVDAAGNVYVTGSSRDTGTDYDYATIKYNSNGVEQWVSHYNGPANATDLATALAIDTAGNVYVTGYGLGLGTDYDYATIKYDNAGAQQWENRYNGLGNARDEAIALAVDPASGDVYVTGRSLGLGTDYDYATIKYNSAGVQQWAAPYNGPANNWDVATALGIDAASNIYVTGESFATGTDFDYATIKYNSAGVQQWLARYNGPENSFDGATALALDDEGNVYVTGTIGHEKRISPGGAYILSDYGTIKYNSAGVAQWVASYNGPANDEDTPIALAVDAARNVYVTGYSYGWSKATNWRIYTTIKYEQPTPPATIKPVVASRQNIGTEFEVEVRIDSVQNLFGISFDLNYSNTMHVDYVEATPGGFLGNDVLFLPTPEDSLGKVSIGISRKAGQGGVSGSGVVARIKFKASLSTPSGTQVVFSLDNITANNPAGTPISVTALSGTTTIMGVIVWPGDTNNDRIVNAADVLPIGLHWNKTGPVRENRSTTWVGQPAIPWSPEATTYADANGDGVVNQVDVLPIGLNWGKTHDGAGHIIAAANPARMLDEIDAARLCYSFIGNPNPGQEFWVEVQAEEVTSLFGIAFELLYSPVTDVDPQTVEAGSFMGQDLIFFPNIDKANGKISVGISQKSPQIGANGSGVVARFKMKMAANAPAGQTVAISLQNVVANDPSGTTIAITPMGACTTTGVQEFTQTGSVPTAFALLANTPNPFNPSTTIKYDLPQQVEVKLVIFDLMGRRVRTLVEQTQPAGRYAVTWDGRNEQGQVVASGVYLYQLQAGDFVQTRRLALLR